MAVSELLITGVVRVLTDPPMARPLVPAVAAEAKPHPPVVV